MPETTPTQTSAPRDPSKTAPAAEEHPTTTWVCENSKCRYFGVYLVGTVRCLCGQLPVKEPNASGRVSVR